MILDGLESSLSQFKLQVTFQEEMSIIHETIKNITNLERVILPCVVNSVNELLKSGANPRENEQSKTVRCLKHLRPKGLAYCVSWLIIRTDPSQTGKKREKMDQNIFLRYDAFVQLHFLDLLYFYAELSSPCKKMTQLSIVLVPAVLRFFKKISEKS